MKHYLEESSVVLERLQSGADGLSEKEAAARLEKNGKNKLVEGKKESLLHRFLKQLAEPMTIILLVAAAIAAGMGISCCMDYTLYLNGNQFLFDLYQ